MIQLQCNITDSYYEHIYILYDFRSSKICRKNMRLYKNFIEF